MLSKQFTKFHTKALIDKYKAPFVQGFTNEQYVAFLRKFRGTMIYRGNSSLSYKFMDHIWLYLKEFMNEQKQPQDTALLFKQAIFNLIPIISVSNLKRGRKVQTIPILLKQKRRMLLINKWLISSQKNKINVRGIKIDNIAKLILLSVFKKGNAYEQKLENQKRAFSARYILLRPRSASERRGFNQLQNYVLTKLNKRIVKKDVIISDIDNLKKYISAFKFVKIKSRNRYFKRNRKEFKQVLSNSWKLSPVRRLYTLLDWYTTIGLKKKGLAYNKELLNEFIKKYYRVWKKKKEIF